MTPAQQKALALARARKRRAEAVAVPEAQPEEKGMLRRVDDAVRGVADMATFGFSDEIAAKLGSWTGIGGKAMDYEGNLAAQRAQDAEGGVPRMVGQVAGAFLSPATAARTVGGAIGRGAAAGGVYGFGSGEGEISDRVANAVPGALIGGAAGGAVHKIADALIGRTARASIPKIDDLRKISQAGYDAAETAGVIVRPEGMQRVATETVGDLAKFGYHPQLQPKIGTLLSEMERLANTNTTYTGLDTLRKMAGQVAASTEPSERAMATRIIQRLDDYMGNLTPDDVLTGNATQAAAGIRQGRDNWARMRRAEMVDTAALKAERRAASTGTGGNLENALRQNVRGILDNPKRSRGMTAAETEMAEKVVRGTGTQDALRLVGRLSPTTGGLSAMMNVGATAINPLMAIPGGVGLIAKALADRGTRKNVEKLSELIRSGGSTAKELGKAAERGMGSKELIEAIAKIRKGEAVAAPAMARIAAALAEYAH